MPLAMAASEPVASDAIERIDEDDDEVIMMDPKNFYMVYLLRISAFLHSFVAFLMMISYYKLKVSTDMLLTLISTDGSLSGSIGYLQTRKRNRA